MAKTERLYDIHTDLLNFNGMLYMYCDVCICVCVLSSVQVENEYISFDKIAERKKKNEN